MITTRIICLSLVALAAAVTVAQEAQAQELIIQQHEDLSITLNTLNGTEIKSYANVNALAGPNGLSDMIEQMELWD